MTEIILNFKFCDVCKKDISEQKNITINLTPVGGSHYCSKECCEKAFSTIKKEHLVLFCSNWDGKGNIPNKNNFAWERKNKDSNIKSMNKLEEYQGKNIRLLNNELINFNIKKVEFEKEVKDLKKEIDNLQIDKDNAKREVEESNMGRKVILSHPDKCERCDKIDSRGNYLRIIPKEKGGDESKENKIFLCHKCYPIITTYIDDLWEIYHDKRMVRKFLISADYPLDKVLKVKKI